MVTMQSIDGCGSKTVKKKKKVERLCFSKLKQEYSENSGLSTASIWLDLFLLWNLDTVSLYSVKRLYSHLPLLSSMTSDLEANCPSDNWAAPRQVWSCPPVCAVQWWGPTSSLQSARSRPGSPPAGSWPGCHRQLVLAGPGFPSAPWRPRAAGSTTCASPSVCAVEAIEEWSGYCWRFWQ